VKKQPKPWLIFSGLVFQIAAIMYLFTKLGQRADLYYKNQDNHFTLALSAAGIILIIFLIFSQTKNLK
tara:strand:+ start:2100 stop:2303 length:204 start_codon:yes stop_codon:yes gene_type:complete